MATTTQAVKGLTHPPVTESWFGLKLGGHFFRLVDGIAILRFCGRRTRRGLVDVVPFSGDGNDPRGDIRKIATEWARRRGVLGRG